MNSILKGLALEDVTRSIIMVAGVGGAGGNALNHMIDLGINDVTFMACNTDAQALEKSLATIKVQLGSGLGAGNDPEKGSQAAKESIEDIINVLRTEGTRMLFITAGMGGGTGTGASPIIAKAAQELDILTVAIVTTPFVNEGPIRTEQARTGIEELKQYADSLLVLSNDSIVQLYPDLPYDEGFWKADDVLATAVKGIAEIITGHGTVNVDFADVNTVMRGSGRAFMGSGRADGQNRAMDAVEASVTSLLLNHRDIRGAEKILLNISYGDNPVTIGEAGFILKYLQEQSGGTANVIWGTRVGTDNSRDGLPWQCRRSGACSARRPRARIHRARCRLRLGNRLWPKYPYWPGQDLHSFTRHRATRPRAARIQSRPSACSERRSRSTSTKRHRAVERRRPVCQHRPCC